MHLSFYPILISNMVNMNGTKEKALAEVERLRALFKDQDIDPS